MFDDDDSLTCIDDTLMDLDDSEILNLPIPHKQTSIQSWFAFSLLPRYTEKLSGGTTVLVPSGEDSRLVYDV